MKTSKKITYKKGCGGKKENDFEKKIFENF